MSLPLPLPDLASLDLLTTVAERGSISEAAAQHFITQPAASMRLRTLEQVLGVQLLERTPAGSRLTPAGAATVEWARPILDGMRSLIAGAAALRHETRARLNVAASFTIAEYLMPQWLKSLVAATPTTAVNLKMGNSATVLEMVVNGGVELGFVEGPRPPARLRWRTIRDDTLVVVVAASHRWARRKVITPDDLAGTPLILREVGSGTRDVLDVALGALGLEAQPLVELASTTAIKAAVLTGDGVAVLSLLALGEEIRSGRLTVVPCPSLDLSRKLRAVWSARRLSQNVTDLLRTAGTCV